MIHLEDINVIFESDGNVTHAVRDVNLHVEAGEIFGIVGYSGAGKSTLVRTINLLQRPTSGKVTVNGQDLLSLSNKELRQARKKIGMIFQHFNLMESRTIYDNVAYPLKGSGLSKSEKSNKIMELLSLVGLEDKANNYPSQLSGGQKQRVAIARALANEPDILLCDEATSALDPKTTSSILELLAQLNRDLNLTIVIITHEMSVVKDLCDKVAVMEHGVILEQGDILDIFTNPQDDLTKEFIDSATHFDQEMKVVLNHPDTKEISANSELLQISYVGSSTLDPVISRVVKACDVDVNVIYGSIEFLHNTPTGRLLVAVSGEPNNVKAAIDQLKEGDVKVKTHKELLKDHLGGYEK